MTSTSSLKRDEEAGIKVRCSTSRCTRGGVKGTTKVSISTREEWTARS